MSEYEQDFLEEEDIDIEDLSNLNIQPKSQATISAELKAKMDAHSQYVETAYEVFKNGYKTAMKPTFISDIVNGESIQLDPENILIDIPPKIIHPDFEKQKKFCTKNLYKYQTDAICKLYELEQTGYTIHPVTGEKIISNGWQLYLPIGSGKSIIFEWIALWFRSIPKHPIIISTDGSHIPDNDQMRWKDYPYYYENCGYIENHTNAVVTLKNYVQRKCTVILTHSHLIGQLYNYFNNDFTKPLLQKTHIEYCPSAIPDTLNISNVDILVVTADRNNVAKLTAMSHKEPFLRVIIDDYTSMSEIDTFRQIYATSTIFVSGSGFNRDEKDIPPVYYTLKYAPTKAISIVGHPEQTYEGVFRDNIATMDLMGTSCEFALYEFVQSCEIKSSSFILPNGKPSMPENIYPIIKSRPKLSNYLSLAFTLNNGFKMQNAIRVVERDLHEKADGTPAPLNERQVKYYLEWKQMMQSGGSDSTSSTSTKKSNMSQKALQNARGMINQQNVTANNQSLYTQQRTITSRQQQLRQQAQMQKQQLQKHPQSPYTSKQPVQNLSNNPLFNTIYSESTRSVPASHNDNVTPVVTQKCMSCGKEPTQHGDFGLIATCCGAFFCCECLKHMCTHEIIDTDSDTVITDKDNYYCSCCREKNPRYMFNISKKRGVGHMYSYELADAYCDTTELVGHIKFDYTFYMMLYGFKPKYFLGKKINIANDIRQTLISADSLKTRIPDIIKLLPKDQLAIQSIEYINRTLCKLNFIPQVKNGQQPVILFYGCPQYMAARVKNIVETICSNPNKQNSINGKVPLEAFKNGMVFVKDVGQLIGLHANILAIVQWVEPNRKDELQQLMGRILRLNSWDNKIYFYITTSSIDFN